MLTEFLSLTHTLADEARKIALTYYRQLFDVEIKSDSSPVTLADRQIEERLRDILTDKRPDDGIIGEEFPEKSAASEFTWTIDAIDGTKNFVIGYPTFGVLLSLCHGDIPILGLIDIPALGERWIGGKGYPTSWNNTPVRTRPCQILNQAYAARNSPDSAHNAWTFRLEKAVRQIRSPDDCYIYGLLASGFMDLIVSSSMGLDDFLPMVPIIESAGGKVTDWHGHSLTLHSKGHAIAVGDKRLLDPVIELLQGSI